MSHSDKIKEIYARNDLSLEDKRVESYAIKENAFREITPQAVNQPWQSEDVTINITDIGSDPLHRLFVWCEAWKDGQKLSLNLPFIYVNPPLVHEDIEDPLTVIKHLVADTIKRVD